MRRHVCVPLTACARLQRLNLKSALEQGMTRESYVTAKVQELAERETLIAQREAHQVRAAAASSLG